MRASCAEIRICSSSQGAQCEVHPPGAQVPLASEGVSITELDLPPEVRGQASLLALVFGIAMQCSPSRNFSRRQA